jgi:hypothetical protein
MPEKADPQSQLKEMQELMMSMVIQSEAVTNLLEKKGLITKQELLDEMKRVHSDLLQTKRKG